MTDDEIISNPAYKFLQGSAAFDKTKTAHKNGKHLKKVVIAIQARSTSERLPRKVFELIDGKTMLEHVVDRCKEAQRYLNNHTHKTGVGVHVAIVCPYGDPIAREFTGLCPIIEGPEHDVLTRYHICAESMDADYIVRITSDCPLIPNFVISKMIKIATINEADYTSNVFPEVRTACDGVDCEVISRKAIDWSNATAKNQKDREHVTTIIRHSAPKEFKIHHIVGFFQLSHIKLSVDTQEDLERVRAEFSTVKKCAEVAERMHGKYSVHRF